MYYMHAVNPHYAAEHADAFFGGSRFVITESEAYPVSLVQFIVTFESQEDADEAVADNVGKLIDQRKNYPPIAGSNDNVSD